MIEIDGGDGGGQVLRTALGLSARTGDPVRVENVRGNRSTPGLGAQHLTGLRAVARVADAEVDGDELGAETVEFRPGSLADGESEVSVDVGTAGSVTLVLDALLPVADALNAPVTVRATGGTDVLWSPTADHYRRVKLPLLARFGVDADFGLVRRGFYPAGGGEATLTLRPSSLAAVDLTDRGSLAAVEVRAVESHHLADADVAERALAGAREALSTVGVGSGASGANAPGVQVDLATAAETAETSSPGAAVLVRARYDRTLAGFDEVGEKGVPAERVAEDAVGRFVRWRDGPGVVDAHTADQLVPFVALAGGRVRIPRVTDHVRTNAEAVRAFGFDVTVEERPDGGATIRG